MRVEEKEEVGLWAADCLDVWSQYYADIPCAVTVVPTKSFATVRGIVEINLIALTNGAARRKQVVETDIPGMAAYGPCIRGGELLLPSGRGICLWRR